MSIFRAYEVVDSPCCDRCGPDVHELGEFGTFDEANNRARLEAATDLIWMQCRSDAWEARPNDYTTYAIDKDDE